jgi:preprotein translocase subunit YajC
MSFLISDALAQSGGAAAAPGIVQFLPMVALFVIFYFLLIRPNQKRQKEHKNMVSSLEKGDEIVTMGGILGKITNLDENFLTIEVAKGTEIQIQRMSVQAMMPKDTYK